MQEKGKDKRETCETSYLGGTLQIESYVLYLPTPCKKHNTVVLAESAFTSLVVRVTVT